MLCGCWLDTLHTDEGLPGFRVNKGAGRDRPGVIEDFNRFPLRKAKDVPCVSGLTCIEFVISDMKAVYVKASNHASDYQPPGKLRQHRVATPRNGSYHRL